MLHVIEIAEAWKRGELSLSSVRTLCTGPERYAGMRFAPLRSPEKRAVMAMVEALVAQDDISVPCGHGIIDADEIRQDGVKLVTTWKGERAHVWPMCWMNGEPYYPRYDVSYGEQRRTAEEAIRLAYKQYRSQRRGQRGPAPRDPAPGNDQEGRRLL